MKKLLCIAAAMGLLVMALDTTLYSTEGKPETNTNVAELLAGTMEKLAAKDKSERDLALKELDEADGQAQVTLLVLMRSVAENPDPHSDPASPYIIRAVGLWHVQGAVEYLARIIDYQIIDYPQEGGKIDVREFFPAARSIIAIRDGQRTLDAFVKRLKSGDMNERSLKLFVWCLQEIMSKEYAAALLNYAADKEEDAAVKVRIKAACDLCEKQDGFPIEILREPQPQEDATPPADGGETTPPATEEPTPPAEGGTPPPGDSTPSSDTGKP